MNLKVENNFRPCTVGVVMITYNHEKFISSAIEGVLMQETDFSFELIIADDASKDNTDKIINGVINNHPRGTLIRYFRPSRNKGMMPNFIFALQKTNSKYIAICEGDDFWTDPLKLQKQVDFLEINPQMTGCFHDVILVDENSKLIRDNYYLPSKKIFNQQDCLVYGAAYSTAALLFRSQVLVPLPIWFQQSACDYTLDLLITEFGDIAHIHENMGAYRIHSGGVWQGNKPHKNLEANVQRFRVILTNPKFKKLYGSFFNKRISDQSKIISAYYQQEHTRLQKLKYAWYYFYYLHPKKLSDLNYMLGTMMFPGLYKKIGGLFSKSNKKRAA